jgi:hypothetical protein
MNMTVVGNRNKRRSDSNDKRSSCHDKDKDKDKDKDNDNDNENGDDNGSTGTNDTAESMLQKLRIKTEVVPPKSLVIIWILMAAELGFDLITTGIAFFSSYYKIMAGGKTTECCGSNVSMGLLPMTATIPFFLLIVAEITFLGRAILLTLWPSIFETTRIATHYGTGAGAGAGAGTDLQDDQDQVGFEVTFKKNNHDGEGGNITTTTKSMALSSSSKQGDIVEELYKDEIPEFIIDGSNNNRNSSSKRKSRIRTSCCFCYGGLKCFCSCFLRWNAKMVLGILNLLTLLNPFFGCLLVWILLYQSDRTESFIVLGIESLSIILHFISVRMEGGLRTWYSKLLHSIVILPFLVTVTLVLVYIREGGVCYSVEKEMFSFSGCEICPDSLLPPDINGTCISDGDAGTYSLAGSGGFLQDIQDLGSGIKDIKDIQDNFAHLIDRGAEQDSYCSPDTNFCFYKF